MSKTEYIVSNLDVQNKKSDDILSGNLKEDILNRIDVIIKTEEPIYSSLIKKRLLNSYGLKKCGSRLSTYLDPILNSLSYPCYEEKDEKVFFYNAIACTEYRPCSEEIRYSYQIPYIEGAVAISEILNEKKMNKKQLLEEFAVRLDYKRKGAQVVALFNGSYNYYKKHKK